MLLSEQGLIRVVAFERNSPKQLPLGVEEVACVVHVKRRSPGLKRCANDQHVVMQLDAFENALLHLRRREASPIQIEHVCHARVPAARIPGLRACPS